MYHNAISLHLRVVQTIQRFTRLVVRFIDLGIEPVYADPAHPEQTDRHEQAHKDLKAEASSSPDNENKMFDESE